MNRSPVRSFLIALLLFGLAAQGAGIATVASFSDQETAIGEITAGTGFGTVAAEEVTATGNGEYESETVKFELSNGGNEPATIASFSVDTTIDGDQAKEYVKISLAPATGPGATVAEDESTPFVGDGTQYVRTEGATTATIDAGESPFLKIEWDDGDEVTESGLTIVSQENADIAVGLTFEDGSSATYYLAPNCGEDGGLGNDGGEEDCEDGEDDQDNDDQDDGDDDDGNEGQIDYRIDDLSHRDTDRTNYVVSVDLADPGADLKEIRVTFDNIGHDWSDETKTIAGSRGSVSYSEPTSDEQYEIIIEAISEDGNGNEFVETSTTASDTSDGTNPTSNGDLGSKAGPSITSIDISDETNTETDNPRFQFDYSVSQTSTFQTVKAHAISRATGGNPSASAGSPQGTLTAETDYGSNTEFKLTVLIYDTDGVVVDSHMLTDNADGTDPT